jgi:hypothetical protein
VLDELHQWFDTFTGVVATSVVALPVAALTVPALALWRRHTGVAPGWAWRSSLAEVGMVYGTAPPVWLTLLRGSRGGVSLVPLRDIVAILAAGPGSAVTQIGGNLMVFAALGFFGPMRFAELASARRTLVLAACCSVLIETSQYVFQLDRVSSVDDVLLNTVGAGLAALASRRWWRVPAPLAVR